MGASCSLSEFAELENRPRSGSSSADEECALVALIRACRLPAGLVGRDPVGLTAMFTVCDEESSPLDNTGTALITGTMVECPESNDFLFCFDGLSFVRAGCNSD